MSPAEAPPGADPQRWRDLHRTFRPRAGRVMPWLAAAAWVAVLAVLTFTVPGAGPGDVLGFVFTAAAGAWLFSRFAGVRAVPSAAGLDVRNLFGVKTVEWTHIIAVTYGRDSTFVHLDLGDGTTMSVFAIQKADGGYAAREASRLATLVEAHSRAT